MVEPLLDAGSAWLPFAAGRRHGRVVASLRHAAYLETGAGIVALVSLEVARGPLHARVASLPRLAVGEPVEVDSGLVRVGGLECKLDPSRIWRPAAPDPSGLSRARAASDWLTVADRSPLASEPLDALLADGLDVLLEALAGRGAGLTPDGDDVLAGVLLVLALTGTDRATLVASARSAESHAISRAFLVAAAGGESIEPVHRLLVALGEERRDDVDRGQAELLHIGATSGCSLVLGVKTALQKKTALQNGRSASQIA